MEEKIADKLKRFANLPHVVEKRRQLRAMYYVAKSNGGELSFEKQNVLVETASEKKLERPVLIVTCWVPIPGSDYCLDSVKKLALYPLDTYTSYGEAPTHHVLLPDDE